MLAFKAMNPFNCFIIMFKLFTCFYDDALTELVAHYANRTLVFFLY